MTHQTHSNNFFARIVPSDRNVIPADMRPAQSAEKLHHHDPIVHNYTSVDLEEHGTGQRPYGAAQTITSSSESSIEYKRPSRLSKLWADSWIPEYASLALTITAFVGLIWILLHFDGAVVTQMPLNISVNTLIAITTAVIKSSLLLPVAEAIGQLKWKWFLAPKALIDFETFDLASRGPWGALLLIFRVKARYLVSLGAWITLLALAIDPFTQQILRPVPCYRLIPNTTARVPRANNLTNIGTYVGGPFPRSLEPEFGFAIYLGLLGQPGDIKFDCPTGNCTFSSDAVSQTSYQTLAWESACVDVSLEIKTNWPSKNAEPNFYIPRFRNVSTVPPSNITLLREVGYSRKQVWTDYAGVSVGLAQKYENFPEYWLDTDTGPALFSFSALVSTVDWGCTGEDYNAPNATCRNALAVECKLWPTIHNLTSNIELSELKETVVSSQPLKMFRQGFNMEWLELPSSVLRDGTWTSCDASYSYTISTPVAVFNQTIWDQPATGKAPPEGSLWYAEDCVFHIDSWSHSAIVGYLADIFMDGMVAGNYGVTEDRLSGFPWMKRIYHNGTASLSAMEEYAAYLARSMSVHTRMWSSQTYPSNGSANGNVVRLDTCTKVRWAWVVFPACLVLLSLVFVALTTTTTRRSQSRSKDDIGVWKSSALAMLFKGLDEETRQKYGEPNAKSDAELCAKHVKVSITRTDNGFRLVQ